MQKDKINAVRLKNLITKIPGIEFAYSRWMCRPSNTLESILERFARDQPEDVFFLQIGANDGIASDPYRSVAESYRWRGICVEPQRKAFEALQKNRGGGSRIILENVAIDESTRERDLYKIGFTDAKWASGLASFKREVLERHVASGYVATCALADGLQPPEDKDAWITTERVSCTTVDDLLAKHNVERLDALLLDVEGYEFPILRQFNFERWRPRLVAFERVHHSAGEKIAIKMLLKQWGYKLRKTQHDLVALST